MPTPPIALCTTSQYNHNNNYCNNNCSSYLDSSFIGVLLNLIYFIVFNNVAAVYVIFITSFMPLSNTIIIFDLMQKRQSISLIFIFIVVKIMKCHENNINRSTVIVQPLVLVPGYRYILLLYSTSTLGRLYYQFI